ncbi:MAG: histidine phosphatase family protein [Elusimicrobiaceae bacterium]
MKKLLIFIAMVFVPVFAIPAAFAAPAQVIVIRHAEKPETGNELSELGWKRAYALVDFFKNNKAVTRYGTPAAIYGMAPKDEQGTLRAIQTVLPLSKELNLKINTKYKKKSERALANEILKTEAYNGKMVLVCWEHHAILDILAAFNVKNGPQQWPGASFDRAWVLNFEGDKVTSFEDVPQHVLPGDSE